MNETILSAIQAHASALGSNTAITFLESDETRRTVTFRELNVRAIEIAYALLRVASPGDRALMMYPSGLDFIEAFLGCLYAGIVAVPAFPPKKNRNSERILAIADDCVPRLLLCNSETISNVEKEMAYAIRGASIIATDQLSGTDDTALPQIQSDAVAFLQYTSGSTATPKGVIVTHENIVANETLIQHQFEFSHESVMVSWLPMFHDMGLIGGILAPIFVGFHSVLMPPNAFLWRPWRWLQAVSMYRATCTGAPNFAYDLCVRRISAEEKRSLDLSSLRIAYNGAEPVRADTLERFTQAFKECGLHQHACFPCYGMAETTLLVAGGPPLSQTNILRVDPHELEKHRVVENAEGQQLVSCGQIGHGLEVRIIDPKTRHECAVDGIGEIWVSGQSVTSGYLNRPEETAEAYRSTLDDSSKEWFRTGDYGFLRNGELYVTGRMKDLIIIRGRNIYPQDVEQRLTDIFKLGTPNSVAAFMIEIDGNDTIGVVIEASKAIHHLAKDFTSGDGSNLEQRLDAFRLMVKTSREWVSNSLGATLSHLCVVKPGSFPRTSSGKVMRSRAALEFKTKQAETLRLPMASYWRKHDDAAQHA